MSLQRKLAWRSLERTLDAQALRVGVLASFTADPLTPYLGTALHAERLPARIRVGPYDQILGQCSDPDSETFAARPDVLIVWPRLEDLWRDLPLPLLDTADGYVAPLVQLVETTVAACARAGATLLFVLPVLPDLRPLGVGDAGNARGVMAVATAAREAARAILARSPGVLVADAEEVVRELGAATALDARTTTIARIPYTDTCFAAVGDRIARLTRLARRGAAKVAVVDADDTLWGGVIGEEGVAGIDLLDNGPGEAHRAFQRWLLELRRAGTLLALASKNDEDVVMEGLARREMVLRREHLAAWRANWDAKSVNLAAMADELNLGLQSFVFIDDNPVELGEVSSGAPEVVTLQMPADAVQWKRRIADSGVLDRLVPTSSDVERAAAYQVETERQVLSRAMTREAYLDSLRIEVSVRAPASADLARLAQLVAKTNQFTLGGPRHTEAALQALLADAGHVVRVVSAEDRFGDYGVIGAFIVALHDDTAVLDTFVLSCRAMGRGVEEAMLAAAAEVVMPRALQCTAHDSGKNTPGRTFFARHGAHTVGEPHFLSSLPWPPHVARR